MQMIFSFNFQIFKQRNIFSKLKSLKIDLLNCNNYWIQIHFKLPAPLMTYVRPPSPIDVKKLIANLVFLGWSLGIIPSKQPWRVLKIITGSLKWLYYIEN